MRTTHFILSLLVALGAGSTTGCGDDGGTPDTGMTDGGMTDGDTPDGDTPDTGAPDTAPPPVDLCTSPIAVMGVMGETAMVDGDTSTASTMARDLGGECGNTMAARFAPQEVVAYTVPGTGPLAVEFTLAGGMTPTTFDTVVQTRTDCTMVPPSSPQSCFDDISFPDEPRSGGAFMSNGGDTVYLIVTGYAETPLDGGTDRGPWTMAISVRENTAPTFTGGTLQIIDADFTAEMMGMDPDGDINGFWAAFQDASGAPVDVNGDGTPDADPFFFPFDEDLTGVTDFTGTVMVADIGTVLTDSGATQAIVTLADIVDARSAEMTLPIIAATIVGFGEACDGTDILCRGELACNSGTCGATTEAAAACTAATAVTIATPSTTTETATETGTVEMADGHLRSSCGNTAGGGETLYTVDVPAGDFDLIARTDLAGSGDIDTVVYIRTNCEDPATEVICDDDIDNAAGTTTSRAVAENAAAGLHTIVVEIFDGASMSTPIEVEFALRPVLAAGATCDDMEIDDRCSTGPCAGGTCPAAP